MQTKRVNIFNPASRKIVCKANEHDYLGDGTIFEEKELIPGNLYTFEHGEIKSYGLMVFLEELPSKWGYQDYLFEELEEYDEDAWANAYNDALGMILADMAQ